MKTPHTFKFSETISRLLNELAAMPEFQNKTRVIEVLIWDEAKRRGMVKPSNGPNNPHKSSPRKTAKNSC